MKKYLLAFSLILLIVFNSFMPNIVYATDLAPVLATGGMLEGAALLTPVLAPIAVPVAVVATVCISAGIIFHNREEIKVVAGTIYQNAKLAGIAIGAGATSLSADAINFINTQIATLKTTNKIDVAFPIGQTFTVATVASLNNVTIPKGYTITYDKTFDGPLTKRVISTAITIVCVPYTSGGITYNHVTNPGIDVYAFPNTGATIVPNDNTVVGDGSICVPIPKTMISTPSISAPYAADTALNIPKDFTLDGPMADTLIGETDWTKAFPIDAPIDVPIDTPIDVPIAVPISPSITDAIPNSITDKMGLPRFDNTLRKIGDMNTSRGTPPLVKIDLNAMFLSATSRLGSPKSPFHAEPYTLVDFGILQNYKFMNTSLIDYFRGLIGMGFIITTVLYVWRKLIPQEVIL